MFDEYYDLIKAIHVIAVISWMAGMLYLPRLYVYHCSIDIKNNTYDIFLTMERRLIRFITTPAMILSYIFGIICSLTYGVEFLGVWFHIKSSAIILLIFLHAYYAKIYWDFYYRKNKKTARFYKIINEIPTILMIISVIVVILKP